MLQSVALCHIPEAAAVAYLVDEARFAAGRSFQLIPVTECILVRGKIAQFLFRRVSRFGYYISVVQHVVEGYIRNIRRHQRKAEGFCNEDYK